MTTIMRMLKKIRFRLFGNLGLKASALLIAVLVFSLVRGSKDMQRSVYVNVVVEPPVDVGTKILVSDIPNRIRLRLKGSRLRLNALHQDSIPPVEVGLKDTSDRHVYLDENQFDMPVGIEVMQVDPSFLDFHWMERAQREIPITVSIQNELSDNLQWAGKPQIIPETVLVEGPRNIVNGIQQIYSNEFDVSNLRAGTTEREVRLIGPPAHTKFNVQRVLIKLNVEPKAR